MQHISEILEELLKEIDNNVNQAVNNIKMAESEMSQKSLF